MRKLVAALAGLLGIAWLRRRASPPPQPQLDHAAELRAKLARTRVETRDAEPEPAEEQDVEARRRAVHERARRQIDELDP